MQYPQKFVNDVYRIFGEPGRAWLPTLPRLLTQLREEWELAEGVPCPTMGMNYIEFTTTADGQPVALKVGVPHEELFTEMEAMALYAGRGTVRLLATDHDRAAMLLQRAIPGTMLWQVGDNREQTRIAATVMRPLFLSVPEQTTMPHFTRWTERAFRLTRAEWDPQELWPRDLLDRAEEIMETISHDRSKDVVLHGDLHHENILWDEERGWLVIDPKGVIAPRCLQVGRYMENQLPEDASPAELEKLTRERVEIFSDILEMPPEDVAAGGLVDCVLSHVWCFEDHGPLDQGWYQGIELARLLSRLLG